MNSIALLGENKLVAASGSKKLTLICISSQNQSIYFERNTSSECKQLVTDHQQRVVSIWDDGTIIIHQSSDPHTMEQTNSLPRKSTLLANCKTLNLSPCKSKIYYLSEGSLIGVELNTLTEICCISIGNEFDPVQIASNQQGLVFILDKKGTIAKVDVQTKTLTRHSLTDSKFLNNLRDEIYCDDSNP